MSVCSLLATICRFSQIFKEHSPASSRRCSIYQFILKLALFGYCFPGTVLLLSDSEKTTELYAATQGFGRKKFRRNCTYIDKPKNGG